MIRGPREDAIRILELIRVFLADKLKLSLNMTKSKITNPRIQPAIFLGTQISMSRHTYSAKGTHHQRLRAASQLRLMAPMKIIYEKLITAGFMSAEYKSGTPKFL
jgi:hypothetical protein